MSSDSACHGTHEGENCTGAHPPDVLVYVLNDRCYVNLTNQCTARCVFCRREEHPIVREYSLRLSREPDSKSYLREIGDPLRYREIVFCGFGEPTIRLKELVEISRAVKERGAHVRLNTNGHGNLIHARDIVPEIAPYLDEISISLDAPDEETYENIVRPDFGRRSFDAVKEFVRLCVGRIAHVTVTAVELPTVDLEACRRLAQSLGAGFRVRAYEPVVTTTSRYTDSNSTER